MTDTYLALNLLITRLLVTMVTVVDSIVCIHMMSGSCVVLHG